MRCSSIPTLQHDAHKVYCNARRRQHQKRSPMLKQPAFYMKRRARREIAFTSRRRFSMFSRRQSKRDDDTNEAAYSTAVIERGGKIDLRYHASLELRRRIAIRAGADLDLVSAHSRRTRV